MPTTSAPWEQPAPAPEASCIPEAKWERTVSDLRRELESTRNRELYEAERAEAARGQTHHCETRLRACQKDANRCSGGAARRLRVEMDQEVQAVYDRLRAVYKEELQKTEKELSQEAWLQKEFARAATERAEKAERQLSFIQTGQDRLNAERRAAQLAEEAAKAEKARLELEKLYSDQVLEHEEKERRHGEEMKAVKEQLSEMKVERDRLLLDFREAQHRLRAVQAQVAANPQPTLPRHGCVGGISSPDAGALGAALKAVAAGSGILLHDLAMMTLHAMGVRLPASQVAGQKFSIDQSDPAAEASQSLRLLGVKVEAMLAVLAGWADSAAARALAALAAARPEHAGWLPKPSGEIQCCAALIPGLWLLALALVASMAVFYTLCFVCQQLLIMASWAQAPEESEAEGSYEHTAGEPPYLDSEDATSESDFPHLSFDSDVDAGPDLSLGASALEHHEEEEDLTQRVQDETASTQRS